jgi:hypothetical protein
MEGVWLAAVALIPLALLPDQAVLVGAEAPKIFLLRTAAIVLGLLTVTRWWLGWASAGGMRDVAGEARRLVGWTAKSEVRFVGIGVIAVLGVTAMGTALSPVRQVSMWGVDVGVDTTAFANTVAYVMLFGVMAARLRGRAAIDHLLWAIVSSATAVALFGILQALFGFGDDGSGRVGIESTIGNAVFLGSYFAITIPITLGFALAGGVRWIGLPDWVMGALVLLPQVVAVGLTGTRGSLLSLTIAIPLMVGLLVWVGGKPAARLAGLMLAPLASVAVLGLVIGAVAPDDSDLSNIVNRYIQLPSQLDELTGSASIRAGIWERSFDVLLDPRWPDSDVYPEIPNLVAESLRPLIGYGPELFRYAYLQSDVENGVGLTLHAHSFILHTAVELGLVGVAAYGALVIAVGWLLLRLVRGARGRSLTWRAYIAIGLLGALASRIVEQLPGKAQVSDLTLSWSLAALVVALVLIPGQTERKPPAVGDAEDKELSLGHMLPLVVLLVLLIVVWWQAVLAPIASLSNTANALEAQGRRDVGGTMESFNSAIQWSPGVAVNYIGFTSFLISGVPVEDLGFTSTRNLLVTADAAIVEILERNPLDYRAWDFRLGIIGELVRGGLVDKVDLDRIKEIQAQLVRLPVRSTTSER